MEVHFFDNNVRLSRYVNISIYWIRPDFLSKCTYVLISHGMGWEMGTKERTEEWVKKEWQMLLLRISKKFPTKLWLIQGQVNCPAGQFPKVTPPSDLRGQPWLVHQIPQQCWAISFTMFRGQSMGTCDRVVAEAKLVHVVLYLFANRLFFSVF